MRKILFLVLIAACAVSLSACKTMCPKSKAKCGDQAAASKKADTAKPCDKTLFQIMDGEDNDKIITEEEYETQRKAWFKRLDADKNGKVSKDEYVEADFVIIDGPDQDGIISKDEYRIFVVGAETEDDWKKAETKKQPGSCFKAMDQNSDGKIAYEEFIIHRKSWFNAIDTDNDGKVSKSEFKKMRKDEHAFRDTDRDGVLVVEELSIVSPVMPEEAAKDEKKGKSN